MRAWMVMFLGVVACTGGEDPGVTDDPSTTPDPTTSPTTNPTKTPTGPTLGEAVLRREGEHELRGATWTGTETLRLFEDDLFEPTDVCIISYAVTGTEPLGDCVDCNASPEGDGGAHAFMTSGATIEFELYEDACGIVFGAPTVDVASLEELNGRTLSYGWGEEPTGHGYALFTLDAQDEWFFVETMRNPFENTNGVLDKREVDALMEYFLFEGVYAF